MEKRIEKWQDLDSIEVIYKSIRAEEYRAGEDFIDQNESIVAPIPFTTYLLGKGYISKDILNNLLDEDGTLQELLCGYDESFCVFPYGECDEESNFKRYYLLAEYIFQVDTLRCRLFNVLKGWGYDGDDREDFEGHFKEVNLTLDGNDFEVSGSPFGTLHDEWLWVCNHSVEDVNKILIERKGDR